MDLLSALWPYLMGALVGWMASWGLAHRFKYATDSAKTIKVEKLVEKIVEVDNPELIDRLAQVESLIGDYEDQILALRADQVELASASTEPPELLARIADLEATNATYEVELSDLRAGKPSSKAGKPAEKEVEKVVEKVIEIDRPELLARLAELEKSLQASEKALETLSGVQPATGKIEKLADDLPAVTPARTKKPAAAKTTGRNARTKASATPPVKKAKAAKNTTARRDESQLPLPVEHTAEPTETEIKPKKTAEPLKKAPVQKTQVQIKPDQVAKKPALTAAARKAERPPDEAQIRDNSPEPADLSPAATNAGKAQAADSSNLRPLAESSTDRASGILNGSDIDWAAARSLGFKFRDPGDKADFSYVEGIGPKISSLLQEAGISSYRQLEITSSKAIRDILDRAGPRYRLADPGTWPQQAGMIADSRWQDLKDWKEQLKHGKLTEDTKA